MRDHALDRPLAIDVQECGLDLMERAGALRCESSRTSPDAGDSPCGKGNNAATPRDAVCCVTRAP